MTRLIRTTSLVLGMFGLALGGGLWAAAGISALMRPGHGITAGFGRDRGTLVNLRVDADGTLWVQHFPKNLSTRVGPYVDVTRSASASWGPLWRSLWPQSRSDPTCWRLYWHVGPLIIVSIALAGLAVVPRKLRRRFRRRRGLCLNCGYDLRGAVSDICTECGRPVGQVESSRPAACGAASSKTR